MPPMRHLALVAVLLASAAHAEEKRLQLEGPLSVAALAVGAGVAAAGLSLAAKPNPYHVGLGFTGDRNADASRVLGVASVALFAGATAWLCYRLWRVEARW